MDDKKIKLIVAVVLLAIAGVVVAMSMGRKSVDDLPKPASPDELTSPDQHPMPSREAVDIDPA